MHRTATALAALLLSSVSMSAMAQDTDLAADSAAASTAGGFATSEATDPYLWLEEVEGERAMDWVEAHNATSLGVLQGDPRYQMLHDQALAIVEAKDRIPSVGFNRDGTLDNFWQDAAHVRGVWWRTTMDSYRTETPCWSRATSAKAL